jgi:hypothetical protein
MRERFVLPLSRALVLSTAMVVLAAGARADKAVVFQAAGADAGAIRKTVEALPHFWCKRSSARAAMPLRKNGVLGWLVTCCRFVVGAAHDIEKGEAPERLALIALA